MSEKIESAVIEEAAKATELVATTLHDASEPVVTAKALLSAGCHLGHKRQRRNPLVKPYIFNNGRQNRTGLDLIDLGKTVTLLQEAYLALRDIVSNNGKVLIVGTKPCAEKVVAEEATRCGSFYVSKRWLGGALTNFKTINKRMKLLKTLETEKEEGVFDKLGKKEANEKYKLLSRLTNNLDGMKDMRKTPNAIIVVDPKWEHNAVNEAHKLHIPVFGILDTNSNPEDVDYVIPTNDDSEASIRLILGILCDAVAEAKGGNTLYAYQNQGEAQTMSELYKTVDKVEDLKLIKNKMRDDAYAIRNKEKKTSIRKAYQKFLERQARVQEQAKEEKPAVESSETVISETTESK